MRRKVIYITGTRADYGLMRSTLRSIESTPELELIVAVTGMHIMAEFGKTSALIEKDGFRTIVADARIKDDCKGSMARFLGELTIKLSNIMERESPNVILLLGDRAEMLAGAIVGTYMGIPIFHIHGGDVSSTVDEQVRHAITKLSNVHLPATMASAERIIKMGESEDHVLVVGSPSLDEVMNTKPLTREQALSEYGLDISEDYVILLQHPVSIESDLARGQMETTMAVLKRLGVRTVAIYPNADSGGRGMIEVIEREGGNPQFIIFKSLPRERYLSLLLSAKALIGNSSSGLVEAPSLGVPFINIGSRQNGRERGRNVIDVDYSEESIMNAVTKALHDDKFRNEVYKRFNPYGDGKTGERIARIIAKLDLDSSITQKKLSY